MKLITLSGRHGAGKGTVQDALLDYFGSSLHRIVPCTSREPRIGEKNGRDYHFITDADFLQRIEQGQLAFHVPIRSHHSGTLWSELNQAEMSIVDIVPEGARHLAQI